MKHFLMGNKARDGLKPPSRLSRCAAQNEGAPSIANLQIRRVDCRSPCKPWSLASQSLFSRSRSAPPGSWAELGTSNVGLRPARHKLASADGNAEEAYDRLEGSVGRVCQPNTVPKVPLPNIRRCSCRNFRMKLFPVRVFYLGKSEFVYSTPPRKHRGEGGAQEGGASSRQQT